MRWGDQSWNSVALPTKASSRTFYYLFPPPLPLSSERFEPSLALPPGTPAVCTRMYQWCFINAFCVQRFSRRSGALSEGRFFFFQLFDKLERQKAFWYGLPSAWSCDRIHLVVIGLPNAMIWRPIWYWPIYSRKEGRYLNPAMSHGPLTGERNGQ